MDSAALCSSFMLLAAGLSHDAHELDIEGQVLARQGMVRVEGDGLLGQAGDGDEDGLVVLLGDLETLAQLRRQVLGQPFAVHLDHALAPVRSVPLLRRYHHGLLLPGVHAEHRFLEARDELPLAERELQRIPSVGRVEDLAVLQFTRIVHLHRAPLFCLRHAGPPLRRVRSREQKSHKAGISLASWHRFVTLYDMLPL